MTTRAELASRMAEAAATFLDALDADQRTTAQWDFPSDDERRRWFYTPTDHGGLPLAMMTPPQQRLTFALMSTGLSTAGYVTAATIIGLENVLDHVEGFRSLWGRARGRDPQLYYVRIFGEPRAGGDWAWRIGGHHVSLNFSVLGGAVAGSTPLFLGADPASAPLLGPHPLRPLEGVEDLARELARSFSTEQGQVALVSPHAPTDLVGVNRPALADGDGPLPLRDVWRGQLEAHYDDLAIRIQAAADAAAGLTPEDLDALTFTTTPKGIAARHLDGAQQEMLRTLLLRYADRLPEGIADEEAAKFGGDRLHDVHVLWAGGLEPGQPHYYRLHSADLLAEYDNTARDANHVHTVWRDPRGDFGDVLARHHVTDH